MKVPSTRERLSGYGGPILASQRAFTLMELLIAVTVLGLVLVILLGAMRIGYRTTDSGEAKIEALERLRRSLEIIDSQIQSAVPLTFEEDGEKQTYFLGQAKSLRFVSNYSIWGGRSGPVVVNYRVEQDSAGKQTLYASESVTGMASSSETRLLTGCDEIEFKYLETGLTEEETAWTDEWDEDEVTTPREIQLHIKYAGKDLVLTIPSKAGGLSE